MTARWHCKVCKTFGLGGPSAAIIHVKQHEHNGRYGAQVSFGFSPNYANGQMTNYPYTYRGIPRMEADHEPAE